MSVITIDYLNMCRICLSEDQLYDILELDSPSMRISYIYTYFKVSILYNIHLLYQMMYVLFDCIDTH